MILMPPVRSERMSLANFIESPNLDEHFKVAVFIFTDGTAESLLSRIHDSALKNVPEAGNLLGDQWNGALRNLTGSFETRLVYDMLTGNTKSGMFYVAVSGNQLGNFDLMYDPTGHEQIFAGKLMYRDNRTYFDTWTSFVSRSSRNTPASAQTTSLTSRTRAEKACARSANTGSSASSCPYSFIDDPQPAALTAIRSTPVRSKLAMVRRADSRASSSRPAWSASAPQHSWSAGATTSQPSADRTLMVA